MKVIDVFYLKIAWQSSHFRLFIEADEILALILAHVSMQFLCTNFKLPLHSQGHTNLPSKLSVNSVSNQILHIGSSSEDDSE